MAMRRREEEAWLPPYLMGLVLSFLPVPVLCRFRTVCKSWKELLSTPSFHKLCDAHRGNRKPHLFVTQISSSVGCFQLPNVSGTTCFLDLDERRWYTIKAEDFLRVDDLSDDPDVLAMDDGLVCECRESSESRKDRPVFALLLFDPIAKRSRKIPLPFQEYLREENYACEYNKFEITISFDDVARSFRIFLADNRYSTSFETSFNMPFLYVYESTTKEWRAARNPSRDVCQIPRAMSSAFFRGRLFIVFVGWRNYDWILVSYDCDGDTWRLISGDFTCKMIPRLVVSSDRLFLMQGLWMHEIIDGSLCEKGLQIITNSTAEDLFDERWHNLTTAVPILRSDGSCSSVVFVSEKSIGKGVDLRFGQPGRGFLPCKPSVRTSS